MKQRGKSSPNIFLFTTTQAEKIDIKGKKKHIFTLEKFTITDYVTCEEMKYRPEEEGRAFVFYFVLSCRVSSLVRYLYGSME